MGRFQALLSRYRDACNHVAERLNDEGVCLEGRRVAAADYAEEDVRRFQRGLVLSMKASVGKHIAHARVSVIDLSSAVVQTVCIIPIIHNT